MNSSSPMCGLFKGARGWAILGGIGLLLVLGSLRLIGTVQSNGVGLSSYQLFYFMFTAKLALVASLAMTGFAGEYFARKAYLPEKAEHYPMEKRQLAMKTLAWMTLISGVAFVGGSFTL